MFSRWLESLLNIDSRQSTITPLASFGSLIFEPKRCRCRARLKHRIEPSRFVLSFVCVGARMFVCVERRGVVFFRLLDRAHSLSLSFCSRFRQSQMTRSTRYAHKKSSRIVINRRMLVVALAVALFSALLALVNGLNVSARLCCNKANHSARHVA